jgi:hypothetical protein
VATTETARKTIYPRVTRIYRLVDTDRQASRGAGGGSSIQPGRQPGDQWSACFVMNLVTISERKLDTVLAR